MKFLSLALTFPSVYLEKSFLCLNHIKITNYYQNPLAVCIANQPYFNKTNRLAVWLNLFQLFFL